ncbi:PREDICTED: P2X purinoceptor 4-like [Acropora digitifera]|uniref:P2X purinoceptor 4-like n=1 Tax=Acropora digitifera TaxID=70779 RepID=UPI00077ACFBA|nr:PREDICTED: P2X purinoceptor 4-like [Acropora digitifera]
MVACGEFCSAVLAVFFEYDTNKIVHIKSKEVGLINRFIQLVIIGYIIGYVIVYKKGYQEFQEPYSSVTTKVKGVSLTNLSQQLALYGGVHLWDSSDFVIPPEEDNAVFVMTNMIISPNQTQSTCPEDPKFPNVKCTKDSDCPWLKPVENGHDGTKLNAPVCEIFVMMIARQRGGKFSPIPLFLNLGSGLALLGVKKHFYREKKYQYVEDVESNYFPDYQKSNDLHSANSMDVDNNQYSSFTNELPKEDIGGKFSPIPLFLNLGSGLALLGVATVLCDIVVLYVLQKKYFYREKKYQYVEDVESNYFPGYQKSNDLHSANSMDVDNNQYSSFTNELPKEDSVQ